MSDFRHLTPTMLVSPQITSGDVAKAAQDGVTMVINNRPDGEAADQPEGAEIENSAREAGLDYVAIPITHAGFSEAQVNAMVDALGKAKGPILAYCRSGTRSTLLWSLAQALLGKDKEEIIAAAEGAGYDISPIEPALDMYVARGQQL
ncbi:TIGR01244 family phosphatase [Altericroceibacterium spongiae]|uniref:TIGR01244 family phosphatase n=1 Tax=Altericroceibacterium spongiae TaxID=2320269 RepID=A0A420EIS6_9SPHN|nr:TIGR01244 family sulfur transferase [Altericroceibacterium spongiae]RKF20564.1 TIGR01244 family phosphatase [Altericroceibacterium spongiae]